jgi:hypothetical protein
MRLVERLLVDAAPFGLQQHLLEPGSRKPFLINIWRPEEFRVMLT